jgi:hypothetical protein
LQLLFIIQLRKRSCEANENVAASSADEGKQAKAAFDQTFASVERMLPYPLELSAEDIRAFTAKDRGQGFGACNNRPWIKIGNNAEDVLIWNKGLLFVHIALNLALGRQNSGGIGQTP